ncbi:MAG: hypothetical protein ABR581_08120 [Thermoleophilaceae bacterium]
MLVLRTLGAPERRLLRGRRGRELAQAEAEPVPTSRATIVRPEAFPTREHGERWLSSLRGERDEAERELVTALGHLNRALRAYRLSSADPYAREVSGSGALVTRIGFGAGESVAEGRYAGAWELPRGGPRRARRSMEAPEERFAALLGGRERALPSEELTLRARADLDQGLFRQAALQARVALESLLADLGDALPDESRGALEADRGPIGSAANAALRGELSDETVEALGAAVGRMEAALKRRRLGR